MAKKVLLNSVQIGAVRHHAGSLLDTAAEAATLAAVQEAGGQLLDEGDPLVDSAAAFCRQLRREGQLYRVDAVMAAALGASALETAIHGGVAAGTPNRMLKVTPTGVGQATVSDDGTKVSTTLKLQAAAFDREASGALPVGDGNATVVEIDTTTGLVTFKKADVIYAQHDVVANTYRILNASGSLAGLVVQTVAGPITIEGATHCTTRANDGGNHQSVSSGSGVFTRFGVSVAQFEHAGCSRAQTTTAAPMNVDAAQFTPPVGTPVGFCATVTAYEPATGDWKVWHLAGGGGRSSGGTTTVDAGSQNSTGPFTNDGVNTATWDAVFADNTPALVPRVTGEVGKTINWAVVFAYHF